MNRGPNRATMSEVLRSGGRGPCATTGLYRQRSRGQEGGADMEIDLGKAGIWSREPHPV